MEKTLIVTNDFPPRNGGIEVYVQALAHHLHAPTTVVYTSSNRDRNADAACDAAADYTVIRDPSRRLLPTARVAAAVAQVARRHHCTRVLYGAAAPLGLLATSLRHAGVRRQVAITHGHEVWWARLPGTRQVLHRIGENVDVVTFLGQFTGQAIGKALSVQARGRMQQLTPGVDTNRFRPDCGGQQIRHLHGLSPDQPMVVCVSRFVARKGQDRLIECWPQVLAQQPEAVLMLVGGGPYEQQLRRLARTHQVEQSVVFAGSISHASWQLPAYYDAATVFAMPCRNRKGGLEPEALGICYLEAQACATPVIVGNSGGAPDTCREGVTGFVVDGTNITQIAQRLLQVLGDKQMQVEMGQAGLKWVQEQWQWKSIIPRLQGMLEG